MSVGGVRISEDIIRRHYQSLLIEVAANVNGLSDTDYGTLRGYYRALSSDETLRPFYQYNWLRRVQPMAHLLHTLPVRPTPWRTLDAGCGVGTESLLLASLRADVDVVGVDINPERLKTAIARVPFHEQQNGRPLSVKFHDQSVFSILTEQSFDLIWTMEAISHIDPAEEFITAAYDNLNSGGHLVISDSNYLNPAMLWRIFKLRRKGIKHTFKPTSAGEFVSYAEERLFSVPALSRLLRQVGFNDVSTQLSIFLPPKIMSIQQFATYYAWVDRLFNSIPLLRYVGGIYTVVAAKL